VADFQLTEQVIFLGKQPDVRPLLAKAQLYIISSKQEGMPMALVEAMTIGVPVIASDIPGNNFVLQEFKNLLFPLEGSDALAQKISDMKRLTDFERENLG